VSHRNVHIYTKRRKAVVLLLLLCISLFSSFGLVGAQLGEPSAPAMYNLQFPSLNLYTPVEVVVDYTYTQSYSVKVTDFGQTLHQEISTPTSTTFNTTAVDIYNITFTVNYDVWVNQTVTISIFESRSGQASPSLFSLEEIGMDSKGFAINMIITTSTPPSFPSVTQFAEQVAGIFTNQVNMMQSSNNGLVNSIMTVVTFSAALSAISFGIAIAAMVLFLRSAAKKAKIDSLLHRNNKNNHPGGS